MKGSTVVGVDKAQIKRKIQEQHQTQVGLWPLAADKKPDEGVGVLFAY